MTTRINFRYLSEPDMIEAGVGDLVRCTDVMEEALVLLRQATTGWPARTAAPTGQ
jgi:hypothetical protein